MNFNIAISFARAFSILFFPRESNVSGIPLYSITEHPVSSGFFFFFPLSEAAHSAMKALVKVTVFARCEVSSVKEKADLNIGLWNPDS